MAREGFVVYHEWLESMIPFSDEECGRIFRACLEYSMYGIAPELQGNERFIWPTFRSRIDKDREAYESKCMQMQANASKSKQMHAEAAKSSPTKLNETKLNKTKPISEEKESAHARSRYGWVKLTDSQYEKLLTDLGREELERCIQYIDESAQQTGNKNKWKDWNLTIRKCSREGWGRSKPKQYTTAEQYKAPAAMSPEQMRKAVESI